MDTVDYKDFEIHAVPYRLVDSGRWQVNLHILIGVKHAPPLVIAEA